MRQQVINAEKKNVELCLWSKWDRVAHEQTTSELIKIGMRAQDLFDIDAEANYRKRGAYPEEYYKMLSRPAKAELQEIDFSQPFSFYSSYMRVGFTERINVLERETVRYAFKKTNTMI